MIEKDKRSVVGNALFDAVEQLHVLTDRQWSDEDVGELIALRDKARRLYVEARLLLGPEPWPPSMPMRSGRDDEPGMHALRLMIRRGEAGLVPDRTWTAAWARFQA